MCAKPTKPYHMEMDIKYKQCKHPRNTDEWRELIVKLIVRVREVQKKRFIGKAAEAKDPSAELQRLVVAKIIALHKQNALSKKNCTRFLDVGSFLCNNCHSRSKCKRLLEILELVEKEHTRMAEIEQPLTQIHQQIKKIQQEDSNSTQATASDSDLSFLDTVDFLKEPETTITLIKSEPDEEEVQEILKFQVVKPGKFAKPSKPIVYKDVEPYDLEKSHFTKIKTLSSTPEVREILRRYTDNQKFWKEPEPEPEPKPEPKSESKSEAKPESKPEAKPEPKSEPKPPVEGMEEEGEGEGEGSAKSGSEESEEDEEDIRQRLKEEEEEIEAILQAKYDKDAEDEIWLEETLKKQEELMKKQEEEKAKKIKEEVKEDNNMEVDTTENVKQEDIKPDIKVNDVKPDVKENDVKPEVKETDVKQVDVKPDIKKLNSKRNVKETQTQTVKARVKAPVKAPVKEPVKAPVKEPVKDPVKEPVKEVLT